MPRRLAPSLSDLFFLSVVAILFVAGAGWTTLLADGDTGWHIRTGDYILEHGSLPSGDPFSFTRPGQPWYAWEWLADVAFAAMHRWLGLRGVVWLAGMTIAAALTVLFRHLLWRGLDAFLALGACLLAAGASMVHYLARPHVFTLLLLAVSLFLLDRDRRQPRNTVWLLVPLTALWTNLHGGFLALPLTLAMMAAGTSFEACLAREARRALLGRLKRELSLAAACSAATILNPYGLGLHRHIAAYLGSDWIRNTILEFQSPKFRGENMLQFEVLLAAGLMCTTAMLAKREWTGAITTIVWAHAALGSIRHVPLYAIAATPWWAGEVSGRWRAWARSRAPKSVWHVLQRAGEDFAAGGRRTGIWPFLAALALLLPGAPGLWPDDFPRQRFPVEVVARQASTLRGARVFTSDQWADFLIYRFYPLQRVFVDGRSDFYGPELGKLYLRITGGAPGAEAALDRHGMNLALVPHDSPLAALLAETGRWRVLDRDDRAVLLSRTPRANCRSDADGGVPPAR